MEDQTFTCQSCLHTLPLEFEMRTEGYCYMCDPNITVEELLSETPIVFSCDKPEDIKKWIDDFNELPEF